MNLLEGIAIAVVGLGGIWMGAGFFQSATPSPEYTLISKLNKIESISAYECEWFYKNGVRYWNHTQNSPIIAKRDKKYNFIKRFINRQKKNFRRYKSKFFKS